MAISRAQLAKEVSSGPSRKKLVKKALRLPAGVEPKPRTLSKVMRKARRRG